MRELFTGILSVSISGSLLILLTLAVRLIFKKAPKVFICCLWLIVILRMLIPFQLQTSWTLRPELPVVTAQDTQLFIDAEPVMEDKIPALLPKQTVEGTYFMVVDYLKIAMILWMVGVCVIGIYTLITYLRLKFWVREATLKEKGVYVSANVETAFLLGYISPKIYLPTSMGEKEAEIVTAHEKAHMKRGDNWLKLLGFICLTIHWFNPLMWLSYGMLCRDIEDACDEMVIRNLDPADRKAYSEALLKCGKKSRKVYGCPVAFGEISIRNRILNILNYKKPATWISIVLVVVMVFVSVFFVTDPVTQEDPPYYETLRDLLGQPMDVVCESLGISQEELTSLGEGTGYYNTPLNVEYQGVTLGVRLGFSIYNDLLYSFTYQKAYQGNHEQAAADIVALSGRLWKNFGKGYQWYDKENPKRLKEDTAEDILTQYSRRDVTTLAYDQWNLTHQATKPVKTWLDQIEISYLWQKNYAEKAQLYGVEPHYFMEYRAEYEKTKDQTYITITYKAGWQPGHYGAMVSSDYD